jgi:hypothetical protein
MTDVAIVEFSNTSREDLKLLRQFVDFHWSHYRGDPRYIPLLDYEYLGSRLLRMTGYFEASNLFFKHGECRFFLALRNRSAIGRCNAFIDANHNRHWNSKVGFFGNFECIDDEEVSKALLTAAETWLRSRGMTTIRGPQNFPMNEATPGFLVEGFDSRPVIYYHYNKPFYQDLARAAGYQPLVNVLSWEIPVQNNSIEEHLQRISQKVIDRYGVTVEDWSQRPLSVRKREMLEIYNDAWNDNFGFVPFTQAEFDKILDDMQLVMNKKLFVFLYVKGEPAGFFGGVPNILENLAPSQGHRRMELVRAIRMILLNSRVKGFRIGYLGVKKAFRHMGLDGVMLWRQSRVSKELGFQYSDMGWVLEQNLMTVRLIERCGATPSKKYTLFEKPLYQERV